MSNEIIVHFQNLRSLIHEGKTRALQAANAHSIIARWNVGAYLSNRLTERVYGKNVVNEFAEWLVQQEPTLKGFDRRNLYRIRQFFELWQDIDWSLIPENANSRSILIGDSLSSSEQKIVVSITPQSFPCPPVVTRITWGHHVEILNGATSPEERLFYLVLTIKDRYTVMELRRQIKSALFERQMLSKQTLIVPEHPKKEWFAEVFRDRYMIEFLELKDAYSEFELKKALILRMKQFLLELGRDFTFIDEELHLKVGMNDYFVDLVFYHRELQCLVAIDLKIDEFKPEYMGKMNFYLELLDRDVRKSHENPSIGMVLCKSKNDEVVEITMSRQLAPSLVAVYETKFLDKNLLRQLLHKWAEDWQENQK